MWYNPFVEQFYVDVGSDQKKGSLRQGDGERKSRNGKARIYILRVGLWGGKSRNRHDSWNSFCLSVGVVDKVDDVWAGIPPDPELRCGEFHGQS